MRQHWRLLRRDWRISCFKLCSISCLRRVGPKYLFKLYSDSKSLMCSQPMRFDSKLLGRITTCLSWFCGPDISYENFRVPLDLWVNHYSYRASSNVIIDHPLQWWLKSCTMQLVIRFLATFLNALGWCKLLSPKCLWMPPHWQWFKSLSAEMFLPPTFLAPPYSITIWHLSWVGISFQPHIWLYSFC